MKTTAIYSATTNHTLFEKINQVSLVYRNSLYVPVELIGKNFVPNRKHAEVVANFSLNIHELGYYLTEEDLLYLMRIESLDELVNTTKSLFQILEKAKGADKVYQFFYGTRGFAEDIASSGEDPYMYSILHYLSNGTIDGSMKTICFDKETVLDQSVERREDVDFETSDQGAITELMREALFTHKDGWEKLEIAKNHSFFQEIFNNITQSTIPVSETMKEHLDLYLDTFYTYDMQINGKNDVEVRCKETLAYLFNVTLEKKLPYAPLVRNINNATDVLRIYAAYSGDDGSLIKPPIFKDHLCAFERRFFLDLLLNCPNLESDIARHTEYWKRAFERLKPHKFGGEKYKTIRDVYWKLVKDEKKTRVRTLEGTINKTLENATSSLKEFEKGLRFLELFPGIYLRRLDSFVRSYGTHLDNEAVENRHFMYLVCDSLHRTIPNVENTRTVMEMLCYYANRMNDLSKDKKSPRFVKPRGSRKYIAIPPVEDTLCNSEFLKEFYERIYRILFMEILLRFKTQEYLGGVYIDPVASGCVLPTELREANDTGAKILGRGSTFNLNMEHDEQYQEVYIPYIHWTNVIINGHEERVDIDLSVVFYNENMVECGSVNYSKLNHYGRSNHIIATHSGDFTSGGPSYGTGVSEAVLIRRDDCLKEGIRYAAVTAYSYTRQAFSHVESTFFGFQIMTEQRGDHRLEALTDQKERVNKMINPEKTIVTSNIKTDETAIMLAVLDLKIGQLIWADMDISNEDFGINKSDESHLNKLGKDSYTDYFQEVFRDKEHMSEFRSMINQGGNNVIATAMNNLIQSKALLNKPRIYCSDILSMHIDARGHRVTTPDEADLILTMPGSHIEQQAREDQKILTPFMVDRWLNEFLPEK